MQKSSPIRLIKPNISRPEIEAVSKVLESGMLVSGPVVEKFESQLAEYLGVSYAVCVSSGTAALHLALLAKEIKPGDEVIVPAFTFPATANVVEMIGAVPVFIDSEPNGVNLDVNHLQSKLSPKTKAIMPVHGFGVPADMNTIMRIAVQYNWAVIEDAACALGSKYRDKYCGAIGDMGVFSFHPRKLLTTGEGGAITTNDFLLAEKLKSLRNHGWNNGEYRHLGYNYRMTDFQAALGVSQLASYDKLIAKRRILADIYWDKMKSIGWLKPLLSEKETKWNIQTLLVKLDDNINRNDVISYLKQSGIETTIGTYCVPLTHYYKVKYGYEPNEFPYAYNLYSQGLSMPLYDDLTADDISYIVETLGKFVPCKEKVAVQ